MLEDRDYMRQPTYRDGMSATTALTIILVCVFGLQCINDVYLRTNAEEWLSLTNNPRYWPWQLFTFQFLHLNLTHIICNLIGFWWLGHFVENVLGKKRFLVALFGCGAVGGHLQGTLMILWPQYYGNAVVGASAGVSGLLAIFALLEKDSEVRLYFILPIRGIWFLWIWGGISLFFTLVPSVFRAGNVASAAHLGGVLAGIAWVKLGWHQDFKQLPWEGLFERWKAPKSTPTVSKRSQPAATRTPERLDEAPIPDGFLPNDVDAVLDKISASGINSLTARERAILEAARKKMAQR
jgi:membrane associated rhomboid family serine protease